MRTSRSLLAPRYGTSQRLQPRGRIETTMEHHDVARDRSARLMKLRRDRSFMYLASPYLRCSVKKDVNFSHGMRSTRSYRSICPAPVMIWRSFGWAASLQASSLNSMECAFSPDYPNKGLDGAGKYESLHRRRQGRLCKPLSVQPGIQTPLRAKPGRSGAGITRHMTLYPSPSKRASQFASLLPSGLSTRRR